ncbi:hypothetical protein FB446DRAFT_719979 [Lentinula raphanica]|nr:hypothetical protein FB446DRAFT_719979 [Lentinula raphanica]
MSRSTTASRALAILLLGAAISTSGVLAAPTSMDPTQMSSNPSSNGARDLQFQSADGQAHSLSDEGLELELPQTVQVHRGGVEHPDVVLRRDGNRLSFADSGFLSKKDGIDHYAHRFPLAQYHLCLRRLGARSGFARTWSQRDERAGAQEPPARSCYKVGRSSREIGKRERGKRTR